MKRLRFTSAAKRATILVALLGVLGIVAGFALAAGDPPAPSITAKPASQTASTSASFSFTDSQAKTTFICSLDRSPYVACTSPTVYSGLGGGSHSFGVEAVAGGKSSGATTYTWTVIVAPPSITITSPTNGNFYNSSGWSAACSAGTGVCGSATDASGVTSVIVSIEENATGKYWSGSSYSSATETYTSATLQSRSGGANWFYALHLPSPDGQYTLHVRATDGVGLQTSSASPASSVFTVDTAAPPAPSVTSGPANPTNKTSPSFSFADTEPGVSYLCRLDGGAYVSCASPKVYGSVSQGAHTFSVEAVDHAGNTSSAASYSWVIDTTPPAQPAITGHPSNPSTTTTATLSFSDSEAGVTFLCKLDSPTYQPCTSPVTYTNLSLGTHQFIVRAVDAAGNLSTPAEFDWNIRQTTGMPFTIGGNAVGLLYPGAPAQALAVKLTNPNTVPIYVTSLTATLQSAGLPSGCTTGDFTVVQSSIPSAGVNVPANGSVTLPAQSATAPTLQMIDTHVNQNACENASLSITYTGSAHS